MGRADRRLATVGTLIVLFLAAGDRSAAQTPPPPCPTAVKGRVAAVDVRARTITVEREQRRDVFPLTEAVLQRAGQLRMGEQVTLQLNCRVIPYPVIAIEAAKQGVTPEARGTPRPDERSTTTVLLVTEHACKLSVDFKVACELKPGERKELKLSSGDEHQLEATTADGRTWKEKIKASGGQMILEVKFGKPPATVAEYDAQAQKACSALGALKKAGLAMDAVLRDRKYKFHKADSTAVSAAVASWTRELALLKELVAPPERAQATADVESIDGLVKDYAEALVKGLEIAQERNTIMGEATTKRSQAQATLELLKVPAPTAKLLPACAGAS